MARVVTDYCEVGLVDGNISEFAEGWATLEATRLSALTGHVYPANDEKYLKIVSTEILEVAFKFAIHARRVLELAGFTNKKSPVVGSGRWKQVDDDNCFVPETNLMQSIGRIIHARSMQVVFAKMPGEQFKNMGDAAPVYLKVRSDWPLNKTPETRHVEPYGLAWSFLTRESLEDA